MPVDGAGRRPALLACVLVVRAAAALTSRDALLVLLKHRDDLLVVMDDVRRVHALKGFGRHVELRWRTVAALSARVLRAGEALCCSLPSHLLDLSSVAVA